MAFLASLVCFSSLLAPSIDQPDTLVSANDKYLFVSCRRLKTLAIYDRQTASGKPKLRLTVPITGDIKAQAAFSNSRFAIVYALDNLKVWRTMTWDGQLHSLPDIPYWESADGHKEAFLRFIKWNDQPARQIIFTMGDGIQIRATSTGNRWDIDVKRNAAEPECAYNIANSEVVVRDERVNKVCVRFSSLSKASEVSLSRIGDIESCGQVLADTIESQKAVVFSTYDLNDYRLVFLRAGSNICRLYRFTTPAKLRGDFEYNRFEYCRGKLYIWKDCYLRSPLKLRFIREVKVG